MELGLEVRGDSSAACYEENLNFVFVACVLDKE